MPIPGGPRPDHVPPHDLAAAVAPAVPRPPGGSVTGVTLGSRSVRPGDLYAALPGARVHGARFAADAVAAGAVAVLTDPEGERLLGGAAPGGVPLVVVDDPRARLGGVAAAVYGDPGARLTTVGVTGTNGKTTTTTLLDGALRRLGEVTGLVGTVGIRVAGEDVPSTGTTPEAPDLHALLAVMLEHGVTRCAMEVSSHALAQHRVDGLVVDVAGFTNLSRDHLDFHPTMEDYFLAKASLFTPERSRRGVVCVDDAWGARLAALATVPVETVTTGDADAGWRVVSRRTVAGRTEAVVETPAGRLTLVPPLPGGFNVANTLLALALLAATGINPHAAAGALAEAGGVPGRMERVPGPGPDGRPVAVVDFAHTPDAVAAALDALADGGRPLVVVLGAGGDRDAAKRPLMGRAAAERADVVVVTDDNPRSEEPGAIRAAVLAGARAAAGGAEVLEVADRREAIAAGLARVRAGGVLLVAGKGHEQGQTVGDVTRPFDDRAVLRELFAAAPDGSPAPAGRVQSGAAVPAPGERTS